MMLSSTEDSYTNIEVIPILPYRIHEAQDAGNKKHCKMM